METLDAVVVGAGVVGLAVARALALAGREVVILESESAIGTGTSSRNSEVIHAGLYYPTDSLKARLCVRGREMLYAYCAVRGVPHRRCSKLIVATEPGQHAGLEAIERQAIANGVRDLQRLSATQALELEPQLHCTAALLSPSTGIVDSHALMLALLGDAQSCGATLVLRTPVVAGRVTTDGIELDTGGDEPMTVRARSVVNSAGLRAQRVARAIDGCDARSVPPLHLCKGNYFTVSARSAFSRLVYPLPDPLGGLGVHLTLDLAGQMRFGPDVQWVDAIDYRVDAARAERFADAIRRYWPALPPGALQPSQAGIRPKLHAPGEPACDFAIHGPKAHGAPGLVNLYGIESPGLTASLAIAQTVAAMLDQRSAEGSARHSG
jgi:L-2-hydroxyglutarate oxidase LhgO